AYTIERVRRAKRIARTIVATSTDPADDAIAAFCADEGIACFRGEQQNVAYRFLAAARAHELSAFVRICGDSPLIDPTLIDLAVDIYRTGRFDIVTNNLERTFPAGQTVELIAADAYEHGYARMHAPEHFEHVTRFFYDYADQYRIFNFTAAEDHVALKLAVDTPDDLDRVADIICRMQRPAWTYSLKQIVEGSLAESA
ncbi:MAG: hypothetical protein D6744_05715, partial [Planctomycetota bacterium]